MTTPGLRVVPDGLRTLAQRCEVLAGRVGVPLPVVAPSGWQSSGAAATVISADASRIAMLLASRMRATAAKLTKAAIGYEANGRWR